jgi:hypothetical protein
MSGIFVDRIPFAKILVVLIIVFGLSMGLCGVAFVTYWQGEEMPSRVGPLMSRAMGLDVAVMVLSAGGIAVTGVVWVMAVTVSGFRRKVSQSEKTTGKEDDTKLDKGNPND